MRTEGSCSRSASHTADTTVGVAEHSASTSGGKGVMDRSGTRGSGSRVPGKRALRHCSPMAGQSSPGGDTRFQPG